VDKPLKSVTHGQGDTRPMVIFPAAGHHRPLTGTKLYCCVTEAHVCEQLSEDCYKKARGRKSNLRRITTTPPGYIPAQDFPSWRVSRHLSLFQLKPCRIPFHITPFPSVCEKCRSSPIPHSRTQDCRSCLCCYKFGE